MQLFPRNAHPGRNSHIKISNNNVDTGVIKDEFATDSQPYDHFQLQHIGEYSKFAYTHLAGVAIT